MTEGNEERKTPIVEEDFAALLTKFRTKADVAGNIAENISHTGGANVFEEPENLARRLTAWSTEIAPAKRKLIIEQWFAEKGIPVTSDILQHAGMTAKELAEKAAEQSEEEAAVRYVYDTESRQIRMTKKGEPGGTLAQAERLLALANPPPADNQEPPFIVGEAGALTPNPQGKFGGVELLAWDAIRRAQERGEKPDPLEEMARATENIRRYKDAFGGGEKAASNMPSWLEDPAEFLKMMKGLSGESDAVTELRATVESLKDQLHKGEVEAQQRQVSALSQQIQELVTKIEDIKNAPAQGKSELEVLNDLARQGLDIVKTELPSVRGDLKSVLGSIELPAKKSPKDRADRIDRYKKSVKGDEELVEVGKRLFLSE
ncbi:hypothetical protein ES703_112722 [subsurface metagenome]